MHSIFKNSTVLWIITCTKMCTKCQLTNQWWLIVVFPWVQSTVRCSRKPTEMQYLTSDTIWNKCIMFIRIIRVRLELCQLQTHKGSNVPPFHPRWNPQRQDIFQAASKVLWLQYFYLNEDTVECSSLPSGHVSHRFPAHICLTGEESFHVANLKPIRQGLVLCQSHSCEIYWCVWGENWG